MRTQEARSTQEEEPGGLPFGFTLGSSLGSYLDSYLAFLFVPVGSHLGSLAFLVFALLAFPGLPFCSCGLPWVPWPPFLFLWALTWVPWPSFLVSCFFR